jgi:hypothetical protein
MRAVQIQINIQKFMIFSLDAIAGRAQEGASF